MIVKPFDNQTESWAGLSSPLTSPLIIKSFDYFVRPKPLTKSMSNKTKSHHQLLCTLSPTNLLPSEAYLRFLYVSSSSIKTPLSSQVGNLVLVPVFYALSSVLSIASFLRASCCFPAEVKTRSIPLPDAGEPTWELSPDSITHRAGVSVVLPVPLALTVRDLWSRARAIFWNKQLLPRYD